MPAPVVITDPDDPRLADFRDLKAGDRPAGTPRGTGTVIVEGVPAVERLLASPYRARAVFGVPGRVAVRYRGMVRPPPPMCSASSRRSSGQVLLIAAAKFLM